jgi:hypothetical protein
MVVLSGGVGWDVFLLGDRGLAEKEGSCFKEQIFWSR